MKNPEYYKEISMYFDKDACDYDSRYWLNPVVQQMRQSFREQVKYFSGKSMLEIGCGTGMDLVHFGKTHPDRKVYGVDISSEMVKLSQEKVAQSGCTNVEVRKGGVDELGTLFPNQQFDIIYVFFGALNTVENLTLTAQNLIKVLNPGGVVVLSFINKWYMGGTLIELLRLRFTKAFERFKPIWGGYSPTHYLPSHCYSASQVKIAFTELKILRRKGYAIVHPAWFYTNINQKLGKRIRRVLWSIDKVLDRTFLWQFGEYGLLVFKD